MYNENKQNQIIYSLINMYKEVLVLNNRNTWHAIKLKQISFLGGIFIFSEKLHLKEGPSLMTIKFWSIWI